MQINQGFVSSLKYPQIRICQDCCSYFLFFPVSLLKRRILKKSLNFCEILLRIRFIFGGMCIYEKKTGLFSESRVKVGLFVFTGFILLSFVYINKKGRNYPFTDNSDYVTQANAVT